MQQIPRSSRLPLAAMIVATTPLATPPLHAEEAWVLEEILVTAQRRVESLQKAPLSVTAFSADTIEELGILDVEGLTRFAPNVTVNKIPAGSYSSTVRVRGVANPEVIITTDPKVTLYLDGVLIAKAAGSMLDLVDLERIEVLRGPQGTLFGRNAVGGAIAVHTKEPASELDFSQTFDVGNLDLFESQTMLNVPVMDNEAGTLLARGVYMYRHRNGWVEDETGDDWGTEGRQAGRFNLAFARENWGARYAYDQTRWREKIPAPYLEAVGEFTPEGTTPKSDALVAVMPGKVAQALAAMGRDETWIDEFILLERADVVPGEFIGDHNLDVYGHSLTLDAEYSDVGWLGDIGFKSISAVRDLDTDSLAELDGTPVAITWFDTAKQQIDQFTQEFQFVGNTLEERLDYVMGLYWFEEDGELLSYNRTLDFTITGDADPLNEIDTTVGIDNEAWAVYGQGTLADVFTQGFSITLGARYTEETRGVSILRLEKRAGFPQFGGCDPTSPDYAPAACLSYDIDEEEDFDNVSWVANASYEWNDDLMTYARVATGYQSGGFNGRATSLESASTPYAEEDALQYELGLKTSLWQQRAKLNMSVFYTDAKDLQLAGFPPDSNSTNVGTVITNAGASTAYGGEIELQALLTPDLEAYANYSYFKSEFDEYVIGFDDIDGDGVRETPVDTADGREDVQTPEHAFAVGLRYSFGDTGFGELWGRIDYSWQDDILFTGGGAVQTVNAPELDTGSKQDRAVNQQDAYGLLDALITLERIPLVDNGNLRLTVWGRNLTDEDYRYAAVDLLENLGFAIAHYADPRTYGITLSYQFN